MTKSKIFKGVMWATSLTLGAFIIREGIRIIGNPYYRDKQKTKFSNIKKRILK